MTERGPEIAERASTEVSLLRVSEPSIQFREVNHILRATAPALLTCRAFASKYRSLLDPTPPLLPCRVF